MKQIFTAALITLFFSSQAQHNARMIGPGDVNNDPDWVWYQKYPKGLDMYFFNANSEISKVGPGIQTPFFTSGNALSVDYSRK